MCNGLQSLCELLHREFSTITKADYEVFGPELRVLIDTLRDLLVDSKRVDPAQNERLREHVDDLVELDHDIVNFRIRLQEDEETRQTMKSIGKLDFAKYLNHTV